MGGALSDEMEERARREESENPRYRWLGDVPRWKALRRLSRSRLLVLSSKLEGGANAISEALACSVPILSSRISGSIGLLGEDYPGYFPVGDTGALAGLLRRVERDGSFYGELQRRCLQRRPIVDPALERSAWSSLLGELV